MHHHTSLIQPKFFSISIGVGNGKVNVNEMRDQTRAVKDLKIRNESLVNTLKTKNSIKPSFLVWGGSRKHKTWLFYLQIIS